MANVEDIKQELNEAKKQLEKAETALREFEGDEDEGLLLKKLRRNRKGLDEDDRQEKARLEEKEKRLEAVVTECRQHVQELQLRLTSAEAAAQPGNDFVTRALGT